MAGEQRRVCVFCVSDIIDNCVIQGNSLPSLLPANIILVIRGKNKDLVSCLYGSKSIMLDSSVSAR